MSARVSATVRAHIHLNGEADPFTARSAGEPQIVFIDAGANAVIVMHSPAQADSLIRAAVQAKDLLLASQVPA